MAVYEVTASRLTLISHEGPKDRTNFRISHSGSKAHCKGDSRNDVFCRILCSDSTIPDYAVPYYNILYYKIPYYIPY